jgi:cyclic-di-GMP phosphodiesterase, flagellum assembly factor TipF
MRLTAVFVAVCMVLIATSCGAALYFVLGLSTAESALASIAVLTGFAIYYAVSGRLRDRSEVATQIADLSRGTADIARQMAELGRRLAAAEVKAGTAANTAVAATKPVLAEIAELRALIKQLAQSVAVRDGALGSASSGSAPTSLAFAGESSAANPDAARNTAPHAPSPPDLRVTIEPIRSETGRPPPSIDANNGRLKEMEHGAVVAMIREALQDNRLDLYLQPIVTLPQRKVRFYEALARLRTSEGEVLAARDFLPHAEKAGLMPRIDNLMMFRCVQVLRRLLAKSPEIGMFCNVSASTLSCPEFFPQFSEFMDANRALAPSLVLELTQSAYRSLGPQENNSLHALASRGFRFSMDNVGDLRLEPRDLGEHGFRFLKVPAELLLDRSRVTISDIHPADLSGLLWRSGVELIGEKIESEEVVVDLLDYDVKYGQGFLFSPPRPVRAEIMQTAVDRADAATSGEEAAGPAQPALQDAPPVRNPTETHAAA